MKVGIESGNGINSGWFWVINQENEQIATYRVINEKVVLVAIIKNDRQRMCNKEFKSVEAMMKYKGWEL